MFVNTYMYIIKTTDENNDSVAILSHVLRALVIVNNSLIMGGGTVYAVYA